MSDLLHRSLVNLFEIFSGEEAVVALIKIYHEDAGTPELITGLLVYSACFGVELMACTQQRCAGVRSCEEVDLSFVVSEGQLPDDIPKLGWE